MKTTIIRKLVNVAGVAMIQHNGAMANPLNPIVIEKGKLTSIKKKTDAIRAAIAYLEWFGGLYLNDANEVILPGDNVEGTIQAAARKVKRGLAVKSGLIVGDAVLTFPDKGLDFKLLYEKLQYRFTKGVVINRARLFTTRPKFTDWSAEVSITYDNNILNEAEIDSWLKEAGENTGLCDWRPKYGRFEVVK